MSTTLFSLAGRTVLGGNLVSPLRIGQDGRLYQLRTDTRTGVTIAAYPLVFIAPNNFISEVLSASSDKEYEVVFMVPASMTQADLQVGPLGRQTARIPLALL